ncbi:MAG TPA: hypothetical protein VFS34_01715 [Thermoanaerobaculia bacterium]|nr:hypothetical protein [Thermoanaerobaculia bacterium]
MKITDLQIVPVPNAARASARVEWEDVDRSPMTLWFEVEGEAGAEVRPAGEAFLLACAIPAFGRGERRIAIEGTVCPRLRDGLSSAVALLGSWYGGRAFDAIEPSRGFASPGKAPAPRAAFLLSGGVDSLDLLVRNRARFPPSDPASYRDAVNVSGISYVGPPGSPAVESVVERSRAAAAAMAALAGARFVAIRTNLVELEPSYAFFERRWYGSAFLSGIHLLSSVTAASIASGQHAAAGMVPSGSHPSLDGFFSTGAIEIRHEGADRSRLEKVRGFAHDPALRHLFVCHSWPEPGAPNCGRCEKCLRTLAEILVCGGIDAADSFPRGTLTAEAVSRSELRIDSAVFWGDLVAPLREAGREDLSREAARIASAAQRRTAWLFGGGWRGVLRRLDERLLDGRGLALGRRVARRRPGGAS